MKWDKYKGLSIERLEEVVELYFSKRIHNGVCCINEMIENSFQCCRICDLFEVCNLLGTLK